MTNRKSDARHSKPPSNLSKKKVRFTPMLTIPEPKKEKEREEDELDVMDLSKMECYNFHRIGHLARDCKQPKKSHMSRQGKGRFSKTLYAMEFNSESSSKEEEEEEEEPRSYYYDNEYIDEEDLPVDYDYLNIMSYEFEGDGTDPDFAEVDRKDSINLLSVYEMEDAKGEKREVGHITVRSVPLPQSNAEINGWDGKAIIDSGATTQYISENTASSIEGIHIVDIPPRMIRVAGQGDVASKVPVSKIAIFDLKLGDLPVEKINAYVFPLEKPDIVLGMGLLEKHNPLPDSKKKTWEFTRNGRGYQLNPIRRIPSLRVVNMDADHLNAVKALAGAPAEYDHHHSGVINVVSPNLTGIQPSEYKARSDSQNHTIRVEIQPAEMESSTSSRAQPPVRVRG